jgi:hypothetical protein
MIWNSLIDIIEHFNLDVDETNINEIRSALVQLLADSHPDKSGGDFASEEQKEKYNEIQNAIDNLSTIHSQQNALVSINQVTDIIKAVTEAIVPRTDDQRSNIEIQIKRDLKREIKSNYTPIKIGTGTIAAVCTGLITFAKTLNENPIFSFLLNIPNIHLILFNILLFSAILFVFTWFREKRDEQRKEWLFSEDGKLVILTRVLKSDDRRSEEDKIIFSFRSFVSAIQGDRKRRIRNIFHAYVQTIRRILYGSSIISIGIAEQIARQHLSDLENRNIIEKYDKKSLDLHYQIDEKLTHELPDKYYD